MSKRSDLAARTRDYKGHLFGFYLRMSSWRKFTGEHRLQWKKVPFRASSKKLVPSVRGLYAFTLELVGSELPLHGYILYVGLAGDASQGTLVKRFGQYRADLRNGTGRARVLAMMQQWKGDLQFNYVELPNEAISLKQLEKSFLNAVKPPVNFGDFDADVIAVRKATF